MGTRKYMNGNLFEGNFVDGEPNGQGAMRYASGWVDWDGIFTLKKHANMATTTHTLDEQAGVMNG